MDRLKAMETFVTIVDGGSLTAAARAIGKSPPTVVRALAELEETLGAVLLRRTTRRMSLTEEGTVFLERCRQILDDVRAAEEAVAHGGGTPRGTVRITAPVLFGQMHVAPAVTGFIQHHTEVTVELILLDRVVNLVEEGIDIALRIGHLDDSALVATRLGSMRRVVCASPSLLARDGIPQHPTDLGERACIRYARVGSTWRFVDEGAPIAVEVSGRIVVNQNAAAIAACTAGIGFGSFLAYQVAPAIDAGELEVVLEDYEEAPRPVNLVYADARLMSRRLRAFIDWMKDAIQLPR